MGGACSTHGIDEECMQDSGRSLKGRDHSDDLDLDGRVLLEWTL